MCMLCTESFHLSSAAGTLLHWVCEGHKAGAARTSKPLHWQTMSWLRDKRLHTDPASKPNPPN